MTDSEEIAELEKLRRLQELQAADKAEEPASLISRGLASAKRGGSSLMTGFGKNVGGLMQFMGQKDTPLNNLGQSVSDYWGEFGDKNGMEKGLARTAVEGAGGGLVLPMGLPAQGVRSLASNVLGGAGGATGAELGSRFVPKMNIGGKEIDLGGILGGLVGGAAGAFPFAPRQSVAQADIRRNAQGVDWEGAQANADAFRRSGSTTATAAEAIPGEGSGLVALARQASQAPGGEALRGQLSGRPDDLSQIGQTIPRQVGSEVSVPRVANEAAKAAAERQGQLRRAASRPLDLIARDERSGRLPQIPEQNMAAIYGDYQRLAGQQGLSGSDSSARQGFLPEFLDPNAPQRHVLRPQPVPGQQGIPLIPGLEDGYQRNLSSLLLNLAENSRRPTGPLAGANVTIPRRALNEARGLAFDAVGTLPPPHGARAGNAGQEYLRRKEAWVTPATEGPLGAISGNKNTITGVVTPGKLDAVIGDVLPGATAGIMRDLQRGGGNAREIATAILQKKLEGGPTNFPNTLAGNPGSPQERQLMELIQAGQGNAGGVMDRLTTGRQLQQLSPSQGMKFDPTISGASWVRPFRALDMLLTLRNERGVQQEVANLLSDPANLPRLQEIAMFNPMVRRALTAKALITPGVMPQQEN